MSTNTPQASGSGSKKDKKSNSLLLFNMILAVAVIALGATSFFLYQEYQESQDEIEELRDPSNFNQIQEDLVQETVERVNEIVITPDEEPTVATILDIDSLRAENETFYADAQNGDRLLVYTTKAIIFREETGQVVNIAPVFIEDVENLEELQTDEEVNENEEEVAL